MGLEERRIHIFIKDLKQIKNKLKFGKLLYKSAKSGL